MHTFAVHRKRIADRGGYVGLVQARHGDLANDHLKEGAESREDALLTLLVASSHACCGPSEPVCNTCLPAAA